jgi:hypothetical protein
MDRLHTLCRQPVDRPSIGFCIELLLGSKYEVRELLCLGKTALFSSVPANGTF